MTKEEYIESLLYKKSWIDTIQWAYEDIIRDPEIDPIEALNLKSNFTILDGDDQLRLLKQLISASRIDDKRWPARQLAGIIDGWKNQPATEYSTKQYLDQKDYKIVIEYFEESGGEAAILGWECKHNPKTLINENHLSSNGSVGLSGTYFSNKNFKKSTNTFTRIDKEINWVTGGSGWGNKELQYYI